MENFIFSVQSNCGHCDLQTVKNLVYSIIVFVKLVKGCNFGICKSHQAKFPEVLLCLQPNNNGMHPLPPTKMGSKTFWGKIFLGKWKIA